MGGACSSLSDDAPSKSGIETVCLGEAEIADLDKEGYNNRDHGRITFTPIISSDRTPTNSLAAGLARCSPKRFDQTASSGGHLALHRHWQAVIWIFQSGEGIVNVDMVEHRVKAGSVIYVPGNAEHGVRNDSLSEDLVWHYCLATEKTGDVRIRFKNDQGQVVNPVPR